MFFLLTIYYCRKSKSESEPSWTGGSTERTRQSLPETEFWFSDDSVFSILLYFIHFSLYLEYVLTEALGNALKDFSVAQVL